MQDEYALFTADGKCLKEDDLLATHAPSIAVLSLSLSPHLFPYGTAGVGA